MTDDLISEEHAKRHFVRWLALITLAVIAAVTARQIAIGSADKKFEARLAELDTNRD